MSVKFEYEEISKFLGNQSIRYLKVDVDNYSEYWHFHPEIEITYVEKGAGLRIVGDNISPFTSGDLVLLGKNLPHCYKVTDAQYIAMHQSHALQ
ncbi:MAG: cupin domain-containing protein, partial [Bacteroidota bacterium]